MVHLPSSQNSSPTLTERATSAESLKQPTAPSEQKIDETSYVTIAGDNENPNPKSDMYTTETERTVTEDDVDVDEEHNVSSFYSLLKDSFRVEIEKLFTSTHPFIIFRVLKLTIDEYLVPTNMCLMCSGYGHMSTACPSFTVGSKQRTSATDPESDYAETITNSNHAITQLIYNILDNFFNKMKIIYESDTYSHDYISCIDRIFDIKIKTIVEKLNTQQNTAKTSTENTTRTIRSFFPMSSILSAVSEHQQLIWSQVIRIEQNVDQRRDTFVQGFFKDVESKKYNMNTLTSDFKRDRETLLSSVYRYEYNKRADIIARYARTNQIDPNILYKYNKDHNNRITTYGYIHRLNEIKPWFDSRLPYHLQKDIWDYIIFATIMNDFFSISMKNKLFTITVPTPLQPNTTSTTTTTGNRQIKHTDSSKAIPTRTYKISLPLSETFYKYYDFGIFTVGPQMIDEDVPNSDSTINLDQDQQYSTNIDQQTNTSILTTHYFNSNSIAQQQQSQQQRYKNIGDYLSENDQPTFIDQKVIFVNGVCKTPLDTNRKEIMNSVTRLPFGDFVNMSMDSTPGNLSYFIWNFLKEGVDKTKWVIDIFSPHNTFGSDVNSYNLISSFFIWYLHLQHANYSTIKKMKIITNTIKPSFTAGTLTKDTNKTTKALTSAKSKNQKKRDTEDTTKNEPIKRRKLNHPASKNNDKATQNNTAAQTNTNDKPSRNNKRSKNTTNKTIHDDETEITEMEVDNLEEDTDNEFLLTLQAELTKDGNDNDGEPVEQDNPLPTNATITNEQQKNNEVRTSDPTYPQKTKKPALKPSKKQKAAALKKKMEQEAQKEAFVYAQTQLRSSKPNNNGNINGYVDYHPVSPSVVPSPMIQPPTSPVYPLATNKILGTSNLPSNYPIVGNNQSIPNQQSHSTQQYSQQYSQQQHQQQQTFIPLQPSSALLLSSSLSNRTNVASSLHAPYNTHTPHTNYAMVTPSNIKNIPPPVLPPTNIINNYTNNAPFSYNNNNSVNNGNNTFPSMTTNLDGQYHQPHQHQERQTQTRHMLPQTTEKTTQNVIHSQSDTVAPQQNDNNNNNNNNKGLFSFEDSQDRSEFDLFRDVNQ